MNKMSRLFAMLMVAIILFSMIYSVIFVSSNSRHDCTGENCPICEQLQVAGRVIEKISTVLFVLVAIYIFADSLHICCIDDESLHVDNSPVKLKVKLLN